MKTLELDPTELLTLEEAAEMVPGGCCRATVDRWATRGIQGVKLATQKIGGKRRVRRQDLEKFFDRLNGK